VYGGRVVKPDFQEDLFPIDDEIFSLNLIWAVITRTTLFDRNHTSRTSQVTNRKGECFSSCSGCKPVTRGSDLSLGES
jgi:hypothetical protein